MVSDTLSRLSPAEMNDTKLDDEISEYDVDHVSSILTNLDAEPTTIQASDFDKDVPQKSTVAELLSEKITTRYVEAWQTK